MACIRRLNIATRLYLMLGLLLAGLVTVLGWSLTVKYNAILSEKREATRHAVETAHGVIVAFDRQVAAGSLTRDEAQRRALSTLRTMRYGGEEYFWVNDNGPRMLMHPFKPELEGQDLASTVDANGNAIFRRFVELATKDGAGYLDYMWPRPGSAHPEPKLSYVMGYAPWGWVLGSGIYVADRWTGLTNDLRDSAFFVVAVALLLGACFLLLVRSIVRPLADAVRVIATVAQGDLTQAIKSNARDEIGQLLAAMKVMQDTLGNVVGQIRESTDAVGTASREIAQGNADLSQRTEE